MKYPGDLMVRLGRRVCRTDYDAKPIPIDVRSDSNTAHLWCCGTVVRIGECLAELDIFGSGTWAYPISSLKVNHSQEMMMDEQYLWGLTKIRELIAEGLPLEAWDSTEIGFKSTYVSWGLHDREHVWPIGMPRRQDHQYCPLDIEKREHTGCFYRCLAFRNRSELTVNAALELYDAAISCCQ